MGVFPDRPQLKHQQANQQALAWFVASNSTGQNPGSIEYKENIEFTCVLYPLRDACVCALNVLPVDIQYTEKYQSIPIQYLVYMIYFEVYQVRYLSTLSIHSYTGIRYNIYLVPGTILVVYGCSSVSFLYCILSTWYIFSEFHNCAVRCSSCTGILPLLLFTHTNSNTNISY